MRNSCTNLATFVKSWGCKQCFSAIHSGKDSSDGCPNRDGWGVLVAMIDKWSKAFCGCSRPGLVGAICQRGIPALLPAGDGYGIGNSKGYGCDYGAPSLGNWIGRAPWIGARCLWTGVLLPLK